MWDYDKLFADGNIIGVKNCYRNEIFPSSIDGTTSTAWLNDYKNNNLCCKNQHVDVDDVVKHGYTTDFEVQYIIRLDEHGNVVEKLFDRERDMKPKPEPMPELETGVFVRVKNSDWDENRLGFIYAENNRVIYQDGGYDIIDDDEFGPGIACYIVEVYSKDACAFEYCYDNFLIWRSPEYQAYLDSKSN